jgi:hypothetical protein
VKALNPNHSNIVKRRVITFAGVIKERFYEHPRKVVALLKLGYLKELEQGRFKLRSPSPTPRKLRPDFSKVAWRMQRGTA